MILAQAKKIGGTLILYLFSNLLVVGLCGFYLQFKYSEYNYKLFQKRKVQVENSIEKVFEINPLKNDISLLSKHLSIILNSNELIKSIDQEIKSKGFANLKVESSASKQPNYDFRTKYLLAYERLQEFKKVLAEQLYIRGIDSRKINYISERSYVKGPEYLKSEKQAESLFIPFQYVNVKVY